MPHPAFPRTWIGPDGHVVDLDKADRSHSRYVIENAELFSLDPEFLTSLVQAWEDRDLEFDFEYVIALASSKGWVRTSRDEADGGAVSGGSIRDVRRAAKALFERGYFEQGLAVGVEVIQGDVIRQSSWVLDAEQASRFCRFGGIGAPVIYEIPHDGGVLVSSPSP